MKLIQRDGESFLFHISKREKGLLFEVLKLYPLIPIADHRVSQHGIGELTLSESSQAPGHHAVGVTTPAAHWELIEKALKELMKLKPSALPEERYKKFRKMGMFEKG